MSVDGKIVAGIAAGAIAVSAAVAVFYLPRKKAASKTVADLVRPNIRELTPYRCARDDYEEGVLLDANENSIGATVEAPPDKLELNRYPDPYQLELKEMIAKHRSPAAVRNPLCVTLSSRCAAQALEADTYTPRTRERERGGRVCALESLVSLSLTQ